MSEREEAARLRAMRRRAEQRRLAIDRAVPPEGVTGDHVPVPAGQRVRGAPPPAVVGDALSALVARMGWDSRLSAARIHRAWPEIVGEELARRCEPVHLRGGVLVLRVASQPWAVEVGHLERQLRRRTEAALQVTVDEVRVVVEPLRGGRAGAS